MRDGIIRAKLKLEFRNNNWVARGYVPLKGPDGQIARRRVERGVGPDFKTKAQQQVFCDRLNKFYEDRATSTKKSMSFAKAYSNYIEAGHSLPEPGRASRRLHAGCRSGSIRASPELIPEEG